MKHDHAFYTTREWVVARAQQLEREPFCRVCTTIGVRTRATVVDHITPRSKGGHSTAPSNLQSLCEQHHSSKTLRTDMKHVGMRHRASGIAPDRFATGLDGFPIDSGGDDSD